MAQILLALNFGEMAALESAENSDFFHVRKNLYAQLAQNLIADQPPPPLLYGTPVKDSSFEDRRSLYVISQTLLWLPLCINPH